MAATADAVEGAAVAGISFTFRSKPGRIVAGGYLLLAAIAFVTHLVSVNTNPADSGESALPFFLLTLPWGMMLQKSLLYTSAWAYLAYPVGWLLVALNSLILYFPFGIRLKLKDI